jgi:hypothetical protein
LRVLQQRIGYRWEGLEGRAEGGTLRREVVEVAVDFAQAERQHGIDRHLAGFGHLDLREDIVQVEVSKFDCHDTCFLRLIAVQMNLFNFVRARRVHDAYCLPYLLGPPASALLRR